MEGVPGSVPFHDKGSRGVRLELHDLGDSGGTATPAPITGIRLFFGNQKTADHRGLSCCFGCRESHSVPFKGHRPPCPQWADRLPDCLIGVRMRGDVSQSGHRRLDKGGGTEDWLGLIGECAPHNEYEWCPGQLRTAGECSPPLGPAPPARTHTSVEQPRSGVVPRRRNRVDAVPTRVVRTPPRCCRPAERVKACAECLLPMESRGILPG